MPLAVDPQMQLSAVDSGQVGSEKQLRQVCEEFEAFFVQAMFKSMRATIPEGGMIERSNGQKWFEEFMDAEVSKSLADKSDLGIAQALYQDMSGMLSGHSENTEPQETGQYLRTQG
ncbi:MAG: rod-binding protein [Desulfovermiculus sp.]